MSKNKNLNKAKKAKNDEFYTRFEDIQNEMVHYKEHFKGKTIYLNCDDPQSSNFWQYFAQKFDDFGLKKLVATHYDAKEKTYKLEITRGIDLNNDGKYNEDDVVITPLEGNGDFRNDESIEILKEADIVVTNPPFSLAGEFLEQIMEYKKDCIFIGDINMPTTKVFEKYIFKEKSLYFGITKPKKFLQPNGEYKVFGKTCWFTTFNVNKMKNNLKLLNTNQLENDLVYCENFNGIFIDKVKNIPNDFDGLMAVPISILEKNYDNFEVLGFDKDFTKDKKRCIINGKQKYARIIIKHKKEKKNENN